MSIVTLLLVLVAIVNSALGLLLLSSSSRPYASRIYAINIVTILAWTGTMLFFRLAPQETALIWAKSLYVSASLIASNFFFFTFVFPTKDRTMTKLSLWLIVASNAVIAWLVIFGDSIIRGVTVVTDGKENMLSFGELYWAYVLYILFFFLYGFIRLFIKAKRASDVFERRQALYLLTGYSLAANIAFVTNLILPWFGYFELNWAGQVSTVTMVSLATYAIFKHQLFNVRVVATEILVGMLWVFLLIRTILAETAEDRIVDGTLLIVTIVIGVLLIRGAIREVRARERIESLAKDLEQANERLKELDQQKSEFVSLASHQLRGPLTAIKGYASLIIEGDFGEISAPVRQAVETIFKSTQALVVLVGDYLDVSRIEQGRMQYDFSVFGLKDLASSIISELTPNVQAAGLDLRFNAPDSDPCAVRADQGKIKQVISNLVDNATKYTPKGAITVAVSRKKVAGKKDMISVTIADTGVGIHPDVLPRLFEKFTRAPDASKTNIMGTGLGLYVAKKMVEAHQGKIWAESDGPGKGSTFHIELEASS